MDIEWRCYHVSRDRLMTFKSQKLRDSASGQICTFQIPGICNGDKSTVVLCHLPSGISGMGMKSPDYFAAFGCSACHEHFDQNRLEPLIKEQTAKRALVRTWGIWLEMGLLSFPKTGKRRKVSSKIVQGGGLYRSADHG